MLLFSVGCTGLIDFHSPRTQSAHSLESNLHRYDLHREISGEMLASGCFGCHGYLGQSRRDAIPSLAGLSEAYFMEVMEAYRHGGRLGTVMGRIALGYSQEETGLLARYFAAQETVPVRQRVDRALARQGKRLHRQFCRECHGDRSQPADEKSVLLNGQWMNYLRWTLHDYLVGINQTDREMSQQLSALVRHHGEEGLEALVHYYGGSYPQKQSTNERE